MIPLLAASALAVNVTVFTNFNCGGTSAVFPADSSCHSFSGRNSFLVSDAAEHCVSVYSGADCESSTFQFPNPNQDGECTNIEASVIIQSFSASADNTCAN
ncbi:hypothetical protein B0H16DRAFT_1589800 [Mycena metata]|uniref:Uncharacterized protein n=1 Tax=Mycena metata TaxID=1033252 RepID=A0AAD7HTH6_9AGAR|nr:hypothetical protein B0H16DRAFT_1589800 [Mycena metata]